MDVLAQLTNARPVRTAKACGPDPPTLFPTLGSSLARLAMSALTGPTRRARRRWLSSPVHRGEHAISRKPLRRESPVEPVVRTRVLSTMHTRLRVQAAPGLPCAPDASLGRARAREYFRSSLRGAIATKQSRLASRMHSGLLRFARNDETAPARPGIQYSEECCSA